MKIKENSFSIVLAGTWNQSILTPQWIKENLFDNAEEIKVEFATNPIVIIRYRVKNIYLSVENFKVILFSADNSDESLRLMEETAIKLCRTLSHTPLTGVGINFVFIQDEEKDRLFDLFKFKDDDSISVLDWSTAQSNIIRKLTRGEVILNFKINIDEINNINFEFNYHQNITSCNEVENKIKDIVVSFRNDSIDFLSKVYSLILQ